MERREAGDSADQALGQASAADLIVDVIHAHTSDGHCARHFALGVLDDGLDGQGRDDLQDYDLKAES